MRDLFGTQQTILGQYADQDSASTTQEDLA